MAVVLKTTVPGRVPGVRIPLPPIQFNDLPTESVSATRRAGKTSPVLPRLAKESASVARFKPGDCVQLKHSDDGLEMAVSQVLLPPGKLYACIRNGDRHLASDTR